ncbi:MAG: hypothetical protein M3Y53_04095 [Thermoproteota archaeon]|nr:hypothetical protein [Thermoproteota archaeon]
MIIPRLFFIRMADCYNICMVSIKCIKLTNDRIVFNNGNYTVGWYMIFECQEGHICFSKDDLNTCGMRGCNKSTVIISPIDIKWFYRVCETGLCINRNDLHKIVGDSNIPPEVKKEITKIFPHLL